jgi:carbon monoxide dehydrogenase subunit G
VKFENTFEVDAPIDEVYATLLDVERVAPCVPGAEVLEKTGDDAYQVAIKVKVGPISMTYRGTVEIVERDEANHRAVMRARARETRGQGTADARVELSLVPEGSRTKGTMVSDVQLAGRAAAMGRGIIQDVSAKLITTFSQNLEAMLSGEGAPAEGAAAEQVPMPAGVQPESGAAQTGPAGGELAAAGGQPAPPVSPTSPPPQSSSEQAAAPSLPPASKPRASAPAQDNALPVGQIVGSVLAARLRDPKVLGGIVAGFVALLAAVRRLRKG